MILPIITIIISYILIAITTGYIFYSKHDITITLTVATIWPMAIIFMSIYAIYTIILTVYNKIITKLYKKLTKS